MHLPTFRRPINIKSVASYGLGIYIAFDSERDHPLAATLANSPSGSSRPEKEYRFLHEFAQRSIFGILAFLHLALWNRPSPFIFLRQ